MHLHLVSAHGHPLVPLEPVPSKHYLQFQRNLLATAQIQTYLAPALQHVHWLYEGWDDTQLAEPLTGEVKRIYEQHACYMVRYCSEPERQVATSRAERWALSAFGELQANLVSPSCLDEAEQLVRAFVRQILDVHRHALMHGVEVQTPQERADMAEANGD